MQIEVIAIGQNMPSWVDDACEKYKTRLPKNFQLKFKSLPIIKRNKSSNISKIIVQESLSITKAIHKNSYCIALDAVGKQFNTEQMAAQFNKIQTNFSHITFLIGGPDGLSQEIKNNANAIWSLSNLTYAHPVVRVVLSEQIYRCWSYNQGHPYHRA